MIGDQTGDSLRQSRKLNPMIELPGTISLQKSELLRVVVDELKRVSGVAAVVLGGSYACGTQRADSDLDVAIYYEPETPFAVGEIRRIAATVSRNHDPVVTDFYGWGPWVNGGAWIPTDAGKLDLLYRNLHQVRQTIDEAQRGIVHHDYYQQPVYGFYSVTYLAETAVCIPLTDPMGLIANLKRKVADYPSALRQQIVVDSLWIAEFTLNHARKFAAQEDTYNTVGCLTRVAGALTQALFALNEVYFMTDKNAMGMIANFKVAPRAHVEQVEAVLARPGQTAPELGRTVTTCQEAWARAVELVGGLYQPKFRL
jgi:Nucleotidyltransferase domain